MSSEPTPLHGAFQDLLPHLQRSIREEGYTQPTPVQEQAIPALLDGRDLLASAPTGTGKTAAFTLPILQYLSQNRQKRIERSPRVLVLAPTRELAAQIGESVLTYGRHQKLSHVVIHGGVGYGPQVSRLRRGPEILIATPGRLLDLMQRGSVRLDHVEIFVLDEVDRMLDMGFIHDIRRVIAKLPEKRQTLFLSATLPGAVAELARSLVHDPVRITVAPEQPTVEKISQKVLFVEKPDKDALLATLMRDPALDRVIIFTQMKHTANRVTKKLLAKGVEAVAIHGNKSQNARTKALTGFKRGHVRVLVATDVAARGLDIDGVTHVINYDLPQESETYVHRIGRTARAGSEGDAISFCSSEELPGLREIERAIKKPVPVDQDHPFHSERATRRLPPKKRSKPSGSPPTWGKSRQRGANGRSRRRPAFSR
ncbi:MAG: DEAD/DEAH box helicase [Planctomycetota bacterium]